MILSMLKDTYKLNDSMKGKASIRLIIRGKMVKVFNHILCFENEKYHREENHVKQIRMSV